MDRDERDRLIAAVSQEVLTLLAESHDVCRNPEQVRSVVANGADRVSYHGAGAREVDMVINIGALKSGMTELVREDIEEVVDAAHDGGAICKVIIETAMLTDEEKVIASVLTRDARADFVKTSTGFGGGGATIFDVALMRETVGPELGVKASGGVRTTADAEAMLAAGATRIGASAGVQIVTGDEGDRQEGDPGRSRKSAGRRRPQG